MVRLLHSLLFILILIPIALGLPLFGIGDYDRVSLPTMGYLLLPMLALSIAITAWRDADEANGGYFTCLATGFLWLALTRFSYLLADGHAGLPATRATGLDTLVLGSRFLEALVLLCASYFLTHRLPRLPAFAVGAVVAGGVLLVVWQVQTVLAPDDPRALSEAMRAIIVLLLLVAFAFLYRSRQRLPAVVSYCLLVATGLLLVAELVPASQDVAAFLARLAAYGLILVAALRGTAAASFRLDEGVGADTGAVHDPTVVVDREGRVLQTNAAAVVLAQTAAGPGVAVVGGDCHALFHPADKTRSDCPVCGAIAHCRETSSFDWSYEHGGRRYSITLSPLYLPGGAVRIVHICRDVTEQQRCRLALDASPSRCRAILEHASDGVLLFDAALRVVESSQRMADMLGRARAELPGRPLTELFVSDPPGCWSEHLTTLATGDTTLIELDLRRAGGDPLPVEVVVSLAGPAVYVAGVRDVGHRIRMELALSKSEARRRAIFEHAGLGIGICADGRIVECNADFLALVGRDGADVIGRHWRDLVHPDDWVQDCTLFELSPEGRVRPVTHRLRYLRADGGIVWGETTVSAILDAGGNVRFTIGMVKDITEQQRAEELSREQQSLLLEARRVAEEASEAKSRFLAAASHDLRQPIQAIHLLLHLIRSQTMPDDGRTIIERIGGAVDGLSNMLDTLLDISKLEAGLVVPDHSAFPLAPLLRRVLGEFEPQASAKGLQLRFVDTGLSVYSDPKLLERILGNLLSNAVKYTREGRILFGCRRRGGLVEILVMDTGRGIPPEELGPIFGEFHQVGNKARDRREGLGLGLAIVDRLARLLEHPVRVRSTLGKGSTFSLLVPQARTHQHHNAADPQQLGLEVGVGGAIVLVVDDDNDIREGLGALCVQWGYRVWAARDGEEAFDVIRHKRGAPDILLVDYRLPDCNGVELVTRVRRRFRRRIAALILTGDAAHRPLQDAEAAGIGILRKPTAPDVLRSRLALQLSAAMHR